MPSPQPLSPVTAGPLPIGGGMKINIPQYNITMTPIALTSPAQIPRQVVGLAGAYAPAQNAISNLRAVDPSRLNPRRAKKNDNSYSVAELKGIAGSANLSKSGTKKELVARIKNKLLQLNPHAFDNIAN